MATRGAKPKPAELRLVTGTHRADRHGDQEKVADGAAESKASFGDLKKPSGLKGEAAKAWKRYIEPAHWLDASKEAAAVAFCELWAEFRESPRNFVAARHGQMRAYMSELGLTDERNRQQDDGGKKADPAAKYLG